jgi:hypothetical protein
MMKKTALVLLFLASAGIQIFSQRILLDENFESGPYTVDSIPLRWAKFKINGPGACPTPPVSDWRVRDSGSIFCQSSPLPSHTSKAYYSNKSLSIPFTATTGTVADDWVFTDSLMLIYGDSLKFRIQLGTWRDGQYIDSLQVWITTVKSPSGGTRTRLATITSLPQGSNVWQYKVFNLNAFSFQKVFVGFRYYMNVTVDGIMVNIDNVFVGNTGFVTSSGTQQIQVPSGYELRQNYPNPFNPVTIIEFALPKKEFVNIAVYTPLGETAAVLVDSEFEAGYHEVSFDASNLPGGIYFYKITAGNFTLTRKMSLVK